MFARQALLLMLLCVAAATGCRSTDKYANGPTPDSNQYDREKGWWESGVHAVSD